VFFEIIDTQDQIQDTGKIEAPLWWKYSFKDVRFRYIAEEEVIKGIDLEVQSGQTVAIVGSTGAGKSTIINLLNRFYEINSGTICIDKENIENYTSIPRKQIAVFYKMCFYLLIPFTISH
jgi:ABC-type multidrug transport system fused ATPase/permease subunit